MRVFIRAIVDEYILKDKKFDCDTLFVLSKNLSSIFLQELDFKTKLSSYFEESAWIEVVSLISDRKLRSMCSICTKYCIDNCRYCSYCNYMYHFKCANITKYHRKTLSSKWKCTNKS